MLLAAFEGWNDACQAASNVARHLIDVYPSREVGHIRCEGFYDYQMTRPMLCHVRGRRRIVWPKTTFYAVSVDERHTLIVQLGSEPNYRWREYANRSLRIAEECDVDRVVTLGSMFAECPHTRRLPLDVFTDDCRCAHEDDYSGPVGIPTVLDAAASEQGFSSSSAWVSIPQYLGSDDCAQGTLELLRAVSRLLDVPLDEGDLPRRAKAWKAQASVLLRCNDDLADYVHRLEQEADSQERAAQEACMDTDSARELIAEAESFLRGMADGGHAPDGDDR